MVLHKGMPTLKIWKGFAGFEGFCMSVLLECDPTPYTRRTDSGRGLPILMDHVVAVNTTSRFPNADREGLRGYEFPSIFVRLPLY